MTVDKRHAAEVLAGAGVPASAVLDTRDLHEDPHLKHRGFIVDIEHPELGSVPMLGWAPRLSASHVPIVAAPRHGEHSLEVLSDDLGLSADELDGLREEGIIDVPEPAPEPDPVPGG